MSEDKEKEALEELHLAVTELVAVLGLAHKKWVTHTKTSNLIRAASYCASRSIMNLMRPPEGSVPEDTMEGLNEYADKLEIPTETRSVNSIKPPKASA